MYFRALKLIIHALGSIWEYATLLCMDYILLKVCVLVNVYSGGL